MKSLHRPDLFGWSAFDESRNVDFNSVAWIREEGNVLVDPMPMSPHDLAHLRSLGPVAWIVVTNSDHTRDAATLAGSLEAKIAGPAAEQDGLQIECDRWLSDGDELVPGLVTIELHGSKTPGELALLLEDTTLITGDLIRGQHGGKLNLLPDAKLGDRAAVLRSVRRLLDLEAIETVLVGDGWPVFAGGRARLAELMRSYAKS